MYQRCDFEKKERNIIFIKPHETRTHFSAKQKYIRVREKLLQSKKKKRGEGETKESEKKRVPELLPFVVIASATTTTLPSDS